MGRAIPPQKSSGTVVEFFLFWGMCLFPSGVWALFPAPYLVLEEWRKVGGEWEYGLLCQQWLNNPTLGQNPSTTVPRTKKGHATWSWAAWEITDTALGKLTQPGMTTIQQNKTYGNRSECMTGHTRWGPLSSGLTLWDPTIQKHCNTRSKLLRVITLCAQYDFDEPDDSAKRLSFNT